MAFVFPNWFWTYLPPVLLVVALVVAITMAYRLWHELNEDDEPVSDAEVLSELEEAHAAGEIDDAEFSRVRALLIGPKGSKSGPRPVGGSRDVQAIPRLPQDASSVAGAEDKLPMLEEPNPPQPNDTSPGGGETGPPTSQS